MSPSKREMDSAAALDAASWREGISVAAPIAHFDEDANALVAIACAVGASFDASGPEIVRAVLAALAPLCPGCHQALGEGNDGPHWRVSGGPWWHYRCTDEVSRLARGESVIPSGEVRALTTDHAEEATK